MKIETSPDRASWLAARGKGIGGSDVAAILGISPWNAPLSLWLKKVGAIEDDAPTSEEMFWGNKVEKAILLDAAEQAGVSVTPTQWTIARHPDESELFCSPDGLSETFGAEAKNVHGMKADDWSEGAPPYVACQAQHSMWVTGFDRWLVGASIGGRRPVWCWVERDPSWLTENGAAIMDFLRRIREEDPPPPSGHPADRDAMTERYPAEEPGLVVPLPGEAMDWTDEIEAEDAQADASTKRGNWLKNRIRCALKDAEAGVLADGRGWSWKCDKNGTRVLRATKAKKEK